MKAAIPVEVTVSETEFHILQNLAMSMVDGKICNITTNAIRKIFYVSVASFEARGLCRSVKYFTRSILLIWLIYFHAFKTII